MQNCAVVTHSPLRQTKVFAVSTGGRSDGLWMLKWKAFIIDSCLQLLDGDGLVRRISVHCLILWSIVKLGTWVHLVEAAASKLEVWRTRARCGRGRWSKFVQVYANWMYFLGKILILLIRTQKFDILGHLSAINYDPRPDGYLPPCKTVQVQELSSQLKHNPTHMILPNYIHIASHTISGCDCNETLIIRATTQRYALLNYVKTAIGRSPRSDFVCRHPPFMATILPPVLYTQQHEKMVKIYVEILNEPYSNPFFFFSK